jgi:hypothetical protein
MVLHLLGRQAGLVPLVGFANGDQFTEKSLTFKPSLNEGGHQAMLLLGCRIRSPRKHCEGVGDTWID